MVESAGGHPVPTAIVAAGYAGYVQGGGRGALAGASGAATAILTDFLLSGSGGDDCECQQ